MKNTTDFKFKTLGIMPVFGLALLLSLIAPINAWADNVKLATKPLVETNTSDALPNLMFILDNSGSMSSDFTPDWADSGTTSLFENATYNTQYYNPNIRYVPAVDYTGASLGNQNSPWTSVKNNAFKASDGTSNLTSAGVSEYYYYVAGEYCSDSNLTVCTTSSTPTGLFTFPAPVRWCNTAAASTAVSPAAGACQAIRVGSFTNLRVPNIVLTSTVTFSGTNSKSVSSFTVGGNQIISAASTASTTSSTAATNFVTRINACTIAKTGSCSIAGFRASRSGSVVTITAPANYAGGTAIVKVNSGSVANTAFVTSGSVPGSLVYVPIVPTTTSYPTPGGTAKSAERIDCAGTTCNYTEEMTNFANWWTYYRTRMQGMKSAASLAFKSIDSRYRVGFYTINSPASNYLPIDKFDLGAGNQKSKWYTALFNATPGSGTPLRSALSTVGRIYAGKKPIGTSDPVQYSCQKNFTLLTTDGYWNTDADSDVKDVNGGTIGNLDGGSTPTPLRENTSTASSSSLADAAKYYYDTDLRTTGFTNCIGALGTNVCGDEVGNESNKKQVMTTLTLGLGIDGTLVYSNDYKNQTVGDFASLKTGGKQWSVPAANSETAIDDLWHAAVNANGTYFSARDPKQLTDSLKKALADIQSKVGAGSAASSSSLKPTAGDNYDYLASYFTTKWIGNLEAREVDLVTLETKKTALWCVENIAAEACAAPATLVSDSGTFYCRSTSSNTAACDALGGTLTGTDCNKPVTTSCTGKMNAQVATSSDSRNIKINNGSSLVDFNYGNLNTTQKAKFESTFLSTHLSQWDTLTSGTGGQQSLAVGNNFINYLRGQKGFEDRSSNPASNRIFRTREATLGDITESQPAYVAKPIYKYTDAGYSAFATAKASRAGMVYVGANDGMLHAFNASTGLEAWAFIPTPVIPNLWKLADRDYAISHQNYVNGDPMVFEACTSGCSGGGAVWKTVLIGGLNGGGRGYYALDITNPTTPSLLWEFTAENNPNLGYTFGNPIVTKLSSGQWVALLSSGYNNGTYDSDGVTFNSPTGDGKGHIFVVDVSTGALIKTIDTGEGTPTTPSGLSAISAYADNAQKNNLAKFVYGGDLNGNMWRFDINDTAATVKLFTLKGPGNLAQPITTAPQLGDINKQPVVFVGTGKYLELSDLTNTEKQSIYAIKDTGAAVGNPRGGLVEQTLTNAGETRTISNNSVNFSSGSGWYVDLIDTGERVNVDSFLVNGMLIAPTIVPASSSCSPGGYGWFNAFNYKTGGALPNSGGVISHKLSSPVVGFGLAFGSDGKVKIKARTADGSDPQVMNTPAGAGGSTRTTIFDQNPDGTYGKKSIWRELIPD